MNTMEDSDDIPSLLPPQPLGGVVHTYLGYDAVKFGTSQPADASGAARGAFEHLLGHGSMRHFTDEELANAIHIDPSQIQGLGPSIDALIELLEQRKARILETFDPAPAVKAAARAFLDAAADAVPRGEHAELAKRIAHAIAGEQLRDLERLWYRLPEGSKSQRALTHALERLGEKYEIDQLGSRWTFTGREALDVPHAMEVKGELEEIERLLGQLREALKNAKPAIIDMDALEQFAPQEQIDSLRDAQKRVNELLQRLAEDAGLARTPEGGWQVTPKAMRLYQRTLLSTIFGSLQASRSGRHDGVANPDGAVELPSTRAYEFGDSPAAMDIPQSMVNALLRESADGPRIPGTPVRMRNDDIVVHKTRQQPKCATAVIMDMSGSMRYGGQYVQAKRMALALDGLIRSEYPGDFLQFIEMYTVAKLRAPGEIPNIMPKPVTINEPVVRLRADMSNPDITEMDLPLHFTNIQRALQLSRQWLGGRPTPNRQVMLITDGLPTAHFEGSDLFMMYPPDPRTERETIREAMRCKDAGIIINIFLLPSWSQTEDDVQFAHRMAESTGGRVFFVAGKELDRFVVWDYVKRRRSILG
ncbi:MAG: hypothetical protein EBY29_04980 [Planctomycetes bacterium]|nr:hypothetical protein [Planctomycetota bacterium]